ncbi:MAG: hypothetical protein HFJ51_06855 [Clostridia bacterium]|nr:hypothetical protein [Clostridia bacterium]
MLGSDYNISAVALNENKVFITYQTKETVNNNVRYRVYACIVTINNSDIAISITKELYDTSQQSLTSSKFAIVVFNESKVVVICSNNANIFAFICEITSSEIISSDMKTILSNNYIDKSTISAIALDSSNFILKFAQTNNEGYILVYLFNIDGTNIRQLTVNSITSSFFKYNSKLVKLSNNKFVVVFLSEAKSTTRGNAYLYAAVFNINNEIINSGKYTLLDSSKENLYNTDFSVSVLNENKILIGYGSKLKAMICEISGLEITSSTAVELNVDSLGGNVVSTVALSENRVLIIHGCHLYATICRIEGTEIIEEQTLQLLTNESVAEFSIDTVKLLDNSIFISYKKSDNKVYAIVLNYLNNFIKKVTKRTEKIRTV